METKPMKKEEPEERLGVNNKIEILKAIHDCFVPEYGSGDDFEKIDRSEIAIMDPNSVMMIIPKTIQFKRLVYDFISTEKVEKIPKIDYAPGNLKPQKCIYSTDYLLKMLNIFSKFGNEMDDEVTITLKTDSPLTMENKHVKVILAPRVHDD